MKVSRHDLPLEAFPFTMRFYNQAGDCVHTIEVGVPDVSSPIPVYIPPLHLKHGPVSLEVEYADGKVDR